MRIVELAIILFTGSMAAFSRKFSRRLIISIPDRNIALISRMGWSPGCIRLPPASHPSEPCRNFPDCRPHPATYLLWISAVRAFSELTYSVELESPFPNGRGSESLR